MFYGYIYVKNMDEWEQHMKKIVGDSKIVTDEMLEKIFAFHFEFGCGPLDEPCNDDIDNDYSLDSDS